MSIVGEAFVLVSPDGAGFAKKLQTQLAGAGLGNAGLIAGAAIAAGVVVGLSSIGAEFGKARRIIVQETGAAAADVDKIFASVRRVAEEVPVSLEKAATAADLLFKRGVPLGPQLDKLTKQELFLAKITKSELAPTVEKTTALFAKFAVPVRAQSRELDVLFKASQRSGKSLDELIEPLLSGGAALGQFGFSLDKSIALITQLQIAGVNVQPALAGLRKAFATITKEGGDPQKVLADLIAEFKDGTDPAKAMADAIALFGSRSGTELATAIQKGKFEVGDLLKIITDGKGGILETGEATLTLGDRFTLLRNQAEEKFADIGLAVRKGLVSVVVESSGPLANLAAGAAHLLEAVSPLAVVFTPLAFVLKGVLPSITAFGTGIDVVASGLDVLHNPIGAAVVGATALGLAAFGAADGLIAAAIAAKGFAVSLLSNPIFLTVAAVAALGEAVRLWRGQADPAIKLSKDFSRALFDDENATSIFHDGVLNAADAVRQLVEAEDKANTNHLHDALRTTGSTVKTLTTALTGSRTGFDNYLRSAFAAAKASTGSSLAAAVMTSALQDQRQAFELSAKSQANYAISTGVLSRATKNQIVEQHRFKDGSVNIVGVLDAINSRLSSQAEKQNKVVLSSQSTTQAMDDLAHSLADGTVSEKDAETALGALGLAGEEVTIQLDKLKLKAQDINASQDALALSTAKTSTAYGDLARRLATGETSVAGATLALEKMGLSAAGAATEASNLDSAIQSFVDGAVSNLPDVAAAISDFGSAVKSDEDQLASDRQKNVDLHAKINEALAKASADTRQKLVSIDLAIAQDQQKIAAGQSGVTDKLQRDLLKRSQIIAGSGQASADLAKQVAESNASIIADNKKLADDANPNKFTQNLIDSTLKIATFTTNLRTLVRLGFTDLAGELAKQGPVAAGGLAAGLASAPAKAAIAQKAVELSKATADSYRQFLEKNAPELLGVGAKQGVAVGKAIADGITRELLHNFPFLRQLGITTGDELVGGAKESTSKSDITEPMLTGARLRIPEFRGLGVDVGTAVHGGVHNVLSTDDIAAPILAATRTHIPEFRGLGVEVGTAAGEGMAAGIRAQIDNVGNAVSAVTQHGIGVAKSQWRISSPSQAFAEVGLQVGSGLALGIRGSGTAVDRALRELASVRSVLRQMASDGANVGEALGRGVAQGIDRSQVDVGNSIVALTQHGLAVARGALKITSPSQVFAEIGMQVGAGLAQGISGSGRVVGDASSRLAASVTSNVEQSLAGINSIRFTLPTGDAVDAGKRFGAAVADGLSVSAPDVVRASELVVAQASASFDRASFAPTVTPRADLEPLTTALANVTAAPVVRPTADLSVLASSVGNADLVATVTPSADLASMATAIESSTFTATVTPVSNLTPLRSTLDALAFAPKVTPVADLSQVTSAIDDARFTPPVTPTADLGPLTRLFDETPFTVTPAVDLAPVTSAVDALAFAPTVRPTADLTNVVASVNSASFVPVVEPAVDLRQMNRALDAVSFSPTVTPTVDATALATSGTQAGATFGAAITEGVDSSKPDVAAAFVRITRPTIDTSVVRPIGEQLGANLAGGLDHAGIAVDDATTRLSKRLTSTLSNVVDPSITPGQGLVDSFHKSFGQIADDATELRRFLLALGGTKLAPLQPPSSQTIQDQFQSTPVARPEDRINIAEQQGRVLAGPLAGATLNFPDKTDPLHLAAELAWQLNL